MMAQLNCNEKFKILDIDKNELFSTIKHELSLAQLNAIKDAEAYRIQEAIGNSIEIETETTLMDCDYTRASFYTASGKVIVIKKKQFNVKMFYDLLVHFVLGINEKPAVIAIAIINIFMDLFFQILDEDVSTVYLFLCYEYFQNKKCFDNTEIFDKINKYLKQTQGIHWSDSKINSILLKLEETHVIECNNGVFQVNDCVHIA